MKKYGPKEYQTTEFIASEIRYRRLFEAAKDGIIILDVDTGKINDVNPYLIELLGYSYESFLGKAIWEIGLFKDIYANKDKFLELQQKGYVRYRDLPLQTIDGRIINVEFVSNVYPVNQHKVIQCNIRDNTERKKAEDEIKIKNEELMRLIAEKDKFFSILAHDLKSPVTGFLGLTEMMVKDIGSLTLEDFQSFATDLNFSANNLNRLLTNLLEWSIGQRGLIDFNPCEISLKEMVDNCLQLFNYETAKNKGIDIEESIPEDIFVMADKPMLNIIIRNLISNALKFTKKDGRVSISAKSSKDKVEISVKDTGIGMSKELMNNLFKIDKKTSRRGTNDEPGTGLGLLFCKEFVEKHSEKIIIKSEEGKGSEFVFSLPRAKIC